jgi:hypothetical protein
MADNTFRSHRGRDPLARDDADPIAGDAPNDPLAELARLIGQSDTPDQLNRVARQNSAGNAGNGASGLELEDSAADLYAEQKRHIPERLATPRGPSRQRLNEGSGLQASRRTATAHDSGFHGDRAPISSAPPQQSIFPSEAYSERDDAKAAQHGAADDYAPLDEYEEEALQRRRRGGSIVVVAILGLAVLGTAGAFAYRSMFGGSVLPALPPIIKASDGPNKIVPNSSASPNYPSNQADASGAGAGNKLVSHDEQPVDVQQLVRPAPHVVATVPVFPDPNSSPMIPQNQQPSAMATGSLPASPVPTSPAMPGGATVPTAASGSVSMSPEPKKIHTVAIRPDAPGIGNEAAAAAAAAPAAVGPSAVPMPVGPAGQPASAPTARAAPARPVRQSAAAAPRASSNAPLAILPPQADTPATAPTRTAMARTPLSTSTAGTPAEAAPPSAGGYVIQVTSQRSEADAQAAFHSLQTKYPDQLGGREPLVRRADLGEKGIYYRALVGPFASMEQAAGICGNLKAAGGSCIVQRN